MAVESNLPSPPQRAAVGDVELAPDTRAPQVISSAALLRGRNEIQIEHASGVYLLRQTRTGKLILTK